MEDFQQTFPELNSVEALTKLNENDMKSAQGKERWRNFIMKVSPASLILVLPPYSYRPCLPDETVLTSIATRSTWDVIVREARPRLQLWYDPPWRCQAGIRRGQLDPRHPGTILRHRGEPPYAAESVAAGKLGGGGADRPGFFGVNRLLGTGWESTTIVSGSHLSFGPGSHPAERLILPVFRQFTTDTKLSRRTRHRRGRFRTDVHA